LGVTGFSCDSETSALRELIRLKNDLYFHQYRPQNETYLRGFRQHEQGQNAKDIAAFTPLIEHAEARIAAFVNGQPLPEPLPELPPKEVDFTAATPAEQIAQFKLAPGLEITPFATEPLLANPIHMNFDARGRLWVASSPIYPQILPGAQAKDQILILEDTDGDHVADQVTVFADDLLIPTAVLPDEQGGAYVANSTELLHLQDTDGDGKADTRRVILSGFGTEDTHHILHTFRWTPDALLAFNQSIYIHSHLETPYSVEIMLGSGIWRYRPETARANQVAFGLVNPWGLIFDRWGQSFATDGAGGEGVNYIFPGAAYVSAVGKDRILTGMTPGQPKMCGLEIVTGGHFSEDYQNTLIAPDFRGNRITRFRISEEGSGYVARQLEDLLTCNNSAFRPVDVKMGPDGALYIADWHNPIIQHGEVDFRDPRRDDRHGRIWRLTQTGQPVVKAPAIEGASIEQLIEFFRSPELWTRHMARVHLRSRDQQAVKAAVDHWVAGLNNDDPLFEQLRLEALWTYQAINSIPQDFLLTILGSQDHHARAAAVRVLAQGTNEDFGLSKSFDSLPLLKNAAADPHPQVRLEAVNALREIPHLAALEASLQVLDQPMDNWLDFALWTNVRKLEPFWNQPVLEGQASFSSDVPKLMYVLNASDKPIAAPVLMQLLANDKIPAERLPETWNMLSKFASADDARILFDRALTIEQQRVDLLNVLLSLAEKRNVIPSGDLSALDQHFAIPQAIQLAGRWKLTSAEPVILTVARDANSSAEQRLAAISSLTQLNSREALNQLAADESIAFGLRARAVSGIQSLDAEAGATAAARLIQQATAAEEAELSLFLDAFLLPKDAPDQLAAALTGATLREDVATIAWRKASSAGKRGTNLYSTLRIAAGLPAVPATMTAEEIQEFLALAGSQGDSALGEKIYRRKELACQSCHSIGGAGGQAGPDILSLGASSPVDYILESLITPSAKIKEGFHTVVVAIDDGRIVNGVMVREGESELVLRDAQNQIVTIPKTEIDERTISQTSLMPADLTSKLNRSELFDLVAFLSQLGKDGAYKIPQNRFVRRWLNEDYSQVFSRVDGTLPDEDLPAPVVFFDVDVSTPGLIGLKIHNPAGLKFTHGDQELKIDGDLIAVDLPAGRQRFQINLLPEHSGPLQVELVDIPNSSGHAEPAHR